MIDKKFYQHTYPSGFSVAMVISWLHEAGDVSSSEPLSPSSGAVITPEAMTLEGISGLAEATPPTIAYLDSKDYLPVAATTQAGACLVTEELASFLPATVYTIIVPSPRRAWATLVGKLYAPLAFESDGPAISPSAEIDPSAQLGANVVVGPGVVIGAHTVIEPGCVIGPGVEIGTHCYIEALASIKFAQIGNSCRVGPGARIGQEGFGFIMDKKGHITMPHVGSVHIEDSVRVGANTCIDRGTMGKTLLAKGCRLDNMVQIAHNVHLGQGTIMAAQVGIAGSTSVGRHVVMGGQVGITQHLHIGDGVQIAAQSGVMRDIPSTTIVGGSPAVPIGQWRRQQVALQRMTSPAKTSK